MEQRRDGAWPHMLQDAKDIRYDRPARLPHVEVIRLLQAAVVDEQAHHDRTEVPLLVEALHELVHVVWLHIMGIETVRQTPAHEEYTAVTYASVSPARRARCRSTAETTAATRSGSTGDTVLLKSGYATYGSPVACGGTPASAADSVSRPEC